MNYNQEENIEDAISLEDQNEQIEEKIINPEDFPKPLYILNLDYSQESFYATAQENLSFTKDELVLVPTRYGVDVARFCGHVKTPINASPEDVVEIIRKITDEDLPIIEENKKKAANAGKIFKEKVLLHDLDMKFICCHFLFSEPKVLFFFSANNRVDFRKLVKDLVSIFRIRVELRQIGVRDEPRITGGVGCCGRLYCCHGVSDKLKPVSIKMAKEQNLSLNSSKISGQCGRLLCCLSYEYDWYTQARKELPSEGIKIAYDGTIFKITEVNPLTKIVSLSGEDGRILSLPAKRITSSNGKWHIR